VYRAGARWSRGVGVCTELVLGGPGWWVVCTELVLGGPGVVTERVPWMS
jgi:hypothetical protein